MLECGLERGTWLLNALNAVTKNDDAKTALVSIPEGEESQAEKL